jgi:phage gpG-like protein
MAELPEFLARLEAIASAEWRERLARRMAERTLDLIDKGYQHRRDPYGNAWKQTQQPNPILERTGAFRSSWTPTQVTEAGFTVAAEDVDYAAFHQSGTARIASRKTIPTESAGLGDWQEPLDAVVVEAVIEVMKP